MITTQREGKTVVLSRPARKEIEGDSDFQGGRAATEKREMPTRGVCTAKPSRMHGRKLPRVIFKNNIKGAGSILTRERCHPSPRSVPLTLGPRSFLRSEWAFNWFMERWPITGRRAGVP